MPTSTATVTLTPSATLTPKPTLKHNPSPTTSQQPVPPQVIDSNPSNQSHLDRGPSSIEIVFSQDVVHDGSSSAANNLANYLLVENGKNGKFETTSCQAGPAGDDTVVSFASVQYNTVRGRGVATLRLNPALPSGKYRLFVCGAGANAIENMYGLQLNNGADTVITFSVDRKSH